MPKSDREFPTSIVLPADLKATLRRACDRQGCAMRFKIVEVLRQWEAGFHEREKQLGRGQTE